MKAMEEEKSVLRCGGLAGILGGVLFLVAIPLSVLFPSPSLPVTPEQLMRFPDIRAGLTATLSLIIAIHILTVALVLALYRALRRTSLGSALFGSILAVLGLLMLALDPASLFNVFPALSDLFANAATTAEETTVLLLWEATIGMAYTFFFIGTLFLWIEIIALGVAMLGAPAFGKGFGGEYRSRGGRGRGCVCQIVNPGCSSSLRLSNYHLPSPLRMEGLQTLKGRVGNLKDRGGRAAGRGSALQKSGRILRNETDVEDMVAIEGPQANKVLGYC